MGCHGQNCVRFALAVLALWVLASDTVAVPSTSFTAVHVSRRQTSIKTLQVFTQGSGLMLGETTEAVLTIGREASPSPIGFQFATSVDYRMKMARDDAMRYIHVTYPTWLAESAELTFEDKYQTHEGGSIGTALAVLVRSAIDGFEIDTNAAITGEISANGKVLVVGGVYARVHGAEASNCRLMALPVANFEELINTPSFIGKGEVPRVQVIGVGTVDDAIAVVRTDRNEKLAEALELYDAVQLSINQSAGYLHTPECTEKLARILTLCPNHFSAKMLQMLASGKRPKNLTITASIYFTTVAVQQMMPILEERAKDNSKAPPSTVVSQGLSDLDKLRPVCHPSALPLIDAWTRYIRVFSSAENGSASGRNLEAKRQAVFDAMADLDTNPDLVQKRLHEGI